MLSRVFFRNGVQKVIIDRVWRWRNKRTDWIE